MRVQGPVIMHRQGPGLKILSRRKWYGGGYCGICGHRGEALIPVQVRWWDPDDGWKVGVLCSYCGEEQFDVTPRPGDVAYRGAGEQADRINISAAFGDEDATYTEGGQP